MRLAEARAEPSGTIRISAPVGFGGHFLTSTVFDFLAAYPKTKVELHLTDDTLSLVGNRIDLAFRTGILPDSTLIARKRANGQFQISLECGGMRRATALPLTDRDIAQLALDAAVRNVGMTQLLTEIVITAIKKDMIEEILRKPSPDPAPQAVPESP